MQKKKSAKGAKMRQEMLKNSLPFFALLGALGAFSFYLFEFNLRSSAFICG